LCGLAWHLCLIYTSKYSKCNTWLKKSRKGHQEWTKAYINVGMQSRKLDTPIETRWKFSFFANNFCFLFTWLCQILISCQIAWICSCFIVLCEVPSRWCWDFEIEEKKSSISLLLFHDYCGFKLVGFWGPWLLNAQHQVSSNGLLFWCRAHGTLMFSLVYFFQLYKF
jgi:hypothetical protein